MLRTCHSSPPPVVRALLGLAAVWGCASARPWDLSKNPPVGQVITAERILETGASTAWDALKYTVRTHYFTDYRGQPVRIFADRGVGSLELREEPLVFLDRARLSDIQLLRYIPANILLRVQVLNGTDGTTYFGTSAVAGVILIETTMGAELSGDSIPPDTAGTRSQPLASVTSAVLSLR
ncbi:MAG: TonB-dependent receptor plug domain-containing protein [Gemmatimonadales bacterium]|nr:TonB-dependent receptor plug domain-containing protein [Gemmatimonadales bacterium]NIN11852.1 TonB-dependent receptor plug domain-containing protein [Gemmatimonadales bacterium]NIN50402.1 TonB-dependent receptor plug domain-containing protein [Gemmatimonadales bacterium]NIP07866.1 TonB-dependent receptor plug domain-containing protein [Gemmatimonadales bacterium]NIR02071.1 TonB-dependent receptor plug domain-containing protein [Gemmatimonadales bacterium]